MRLIRHHPSADDLARVRACSEHAPATTPVGASGASLGDLPSGWFRDERTETVGQGRDAFRAAVDALQGWRAHAGAGIATNEPPTPLTVGEVVAMDLPVGPLRTVGACRIVAVVDEPDAFGFAYATLAGHPERGEESFVVRIVASGAVTFTVRAYSRPAAPLVWLGLPLARHLQHRAARRFGSGMRCAVAELMAAAGG